MLYFYLYSEEENNITFILKLSKKVKTKKITINVNWFPSNNFFRNEKW